MRPQGKDAMKRDFEDYHNFVIASLAKVGYLQSFQRELEERKQTIDQYFYCGKNTSTPNVFKE